MLQFGESTSSPRWLRPSDYADFYGADFFADFFEEVFFVAELLQVGVAHEPAEIIITLFNGFDEGVGGTIEPADQGVAAGEVVKNGRIPRLKPGQLLVHFQAIFEIAAACVIVAKDLEGFDEFRVTANDAF